jgi:predicted P-loop ATPase
MKAVAESVKPLANGQAAEPAVSVRETGWIDYPDLNEKGAVRGRSQANIAAFLDQAGVQLAHNEFAYQTLIRRQGRETGLDDASAESLWLEADRCGLPASQSYFYSVLGDTARRNSFHPVRQYLDDLEWDGIERLDTWLHAYLGAQDPEPDLPDDASQEERRERAGIMRELVQQYGRKTLIGAVRRVREPGCKHDTLLVLQGKQGLGKSTAIKALCPDKAWFTDSLKIGEDKKAIIELTTGCWLIELAELAGMSKRESGTVKGMLAGDRDDARQAYGKFTTRRERQFLCIGTINENEFLQDPTGNRRYWTVSLNNQTDADKVKAELTRDRDQLWAEADYFVRKGEDSTLPKRLWAAAAIEQGSRRIVDPWEGKLEALFQEADYVPQERIYEALGMLTHQQNPAVTRRVSGILTAMGFELCQKRGEGGRRERGYRRPA